MEIRHFITFKKIIDLGSFTKAANYLGYTQSTVTSHIQSLENDLNIKLFDKVGRRNVLTSSGEEVLTYTRELLKVVEKINSVSDNLYKAGEIKIGAPESIIVYMLEPILTKYTKKFPKVKISIVNGNCSYLKELLLKGDIDITFLMMPEFNDPNLEVKKINEENLVMVANKDFDFNTIDLELTNQVIDKCIIYNELGCSYRKSFENYINSKNIMFSNSMELWSIESIKQCVKSGLGISILPEVTVREDVSRGVLVSKDFNCIDNKVCSLLVYHKNKWISNPLNEFINLCSELL